MFNFLKRDPAQEKLKIPGELFSVTAAAASNACNILNGAGLNGKFSREAIFTEVCGYHVRTVILSISRVEDIAGSERGFDQGERFLAEQAPRVLSRVRDPKVASGLRGQGFTAEDLALMEKLLFAEKTFYLAASYYSGLGLDVSDDDVRALGRYYPKVLAHSVRELGPQFAYAVKCWKLSHLEDIPNVELRTFHLMRFNDTLTRALIELEANVEKLLPQS